MEFKSDFSNVCVPHDHHTSLRTQRTGNSCRNRPAESTIEQLIIKILYFRGDLYGQDLSNAIGLKFSVIQNMVETLKLQHHLQVKRSLGMGKCRRRILA